MKMTVLPLNTERFLENKMPYESDTSPRLLLVSDSTGRFPCSHRFQDWSLREWKFPVSPYLYQRKGLSHKAKWKLNDFLYKMNDFTNLNSLKITYRSWDIAVITVDWCPLLFLPCGSLHVHPAVLWLEDTPTLLDLVCRHIYLANAP